MNSHINTLTLSNQFADATHDPTQTLCPHPHLMYTPSANMKPLKPTKALFGQPTPKRLPPHLLRNASIIHYNTAQEADFSKQNYTVTPRCWYIDAEFPCQDCGKTFLFSADEQRFWYEDLHFYVDSLPNRCPSCRKTERTRLALKKQYDSLITTALGPCPPETKKQLIDIINQLEAANETLPEKMKENRATLLKQLTKGD